MFIRSLIVNGHAVDLILLVIVVEFIYLYMNSGRQGRVSSLINIGCALAPGACILLALRAALTGAGWVWIAGFLAIAFPFHLFDSARRWSHKKVRDQSCDPLSR